jgi:hypothetical protein
MFILELGRAERIEMLIGRFGCAAVILEGCRGRRRVRVVVETW